MDEGRRNFLVSEIISGVKFITYNGMRYKLIPSSKELKLLAEHIYRDTINSLRFDNLITKDRATLFLQRSGTWKEEDNQALEKLEKYLEDKKVELYNSLYNSSRQTTIRRVIATAKSSINKAYAKKHSLDYMTLDYHALLAKKQFLIAMSIRDKNNNSVYNEDTFLNSDSTIVEAIIDFLSSDHITVEEFRELARNDPWRTMWNLGKESCIGLPIAEWTEDQKMLVTFAKMYDNAYQSMDCPPDEVFEDDDMFDGWMIDQRRKRDTDQKQKQVDNMKNVPDSAQEVFVFAPTRDDANKVYNLNDPESRNKIRQREKFLDQHGEELIPAQNLPDTQLELRKQQIEEYKNKMKRG